MVNDNVKLIMRKPVRRSAWTLSHFEAPSRMLEAESQRGRKKNVYIARNKEIATAPKKALAKVDRSKLAEAEDLAALHLLN